MQNEVSKGDASWSNPIFHDHGSVAATLATVGVQPLAPGVDTVGPEQNILMAHIEAAKQSKENEDKETPNKKNNVDLELLAGQLQEKMNRACEKSQEKTKGVVEAKSVATPKSFADGQSRAEGDDAVPGLARALETMESRYGALPLLETLDLTKPPMDVQDGKAEEVAVDFCDHQGVARSPCTKGR